MINQLQSLGAGMIAEKGFGRIVDYPEHDLAEFYYKCNSYFNAAYYMKLIPCSVLDKEIDRNASKLKSLGTCSDGFE